MDLPKITDVKNATLTRFITNMPESKDVPHQNIMISGRCGTGKTLLAINTTKNHHANGGLFCYITTRNDKDIVDEIKATAENVLIISSTNDMIFIEKGIQDFIDGKRSLLIMPHENFGCDAFFTFVINTIFIKCADIRRHSAAITHLSKQSLEKLLIIDEAINIEDTRLNDMLSVTKKAGITTITVLIYARNHIHAVANSDTKVLLTGSEEESCFWSNIIGSPVNQYEIPKYHATVYQG
jgi:hypothetical protein